MTDVTAEAALSGSSPRLEEITPSNVDAALAIKVRADQQFAVAPVVKSLAEAYAHRDVAWPRLIVADDRPVGFLMAFLDIDWHMDGTVFRSGLWRLNIAAGEQGRGYGRFAVQSVAEEIRRRGGTRCHVTWEEGEGGPAGFYLGLGFRRTGETSGGQTVGVLELGGSLSAPSPPPRPAPGTPPGSPAAADGGGGRHG